MDATADGRWTPERVVTGDELRRQLRSAGELRPLPAAAPGEVAARWAWADGSGEVGFITPVSRPFCGDCTRGRLSADGRFFTCLFARKARDLRGPLRAGAPTAALEALVREAWAAREDRHCEERAAGQAPPNSPAQMSFLGG